MNSLKMKALKIRNETRDQVEKDQKVLRRQKRAKELYLKKHGIEFWIDKDHAHLISLASQNDNLWRTFISPKIVSCNCPSFKNLINEKHYYCKHVLLLSAYIIDALPKLSKTGKMNNKEK